MATWTYTITFADAVPWAEARRVIYWCDRLLADDAARAHMARFAEPPHGYRPRLAPGAGPRQRAQRVRLATDEEIDDFGE